MFRRIAPLNLFAKVACAVITAASSYCTPLFTRWFRLRIPGTFIGFGGTGGGGGIGGGPPGPLPGPPPLPLPLPLPLTGGGGGGLPPELEDVVSDDELDELAGADGIDELDEDDELDELDGAELVGGTLVGTS